MIYRLNLYIGDRLTSTELVEARKVQEANDLARRAVETGQAARAEVQYITGGIAFGCTAKAVDVDPRTSDLVGKRASTKGGAGQPSPAAPSDAC